ncbi:Metalloenzyme, LuxS/M16 peptidase-like protein [Polychytrium aggregatum]|uniref:Metalloenzyme, LuxS/M16 peptidase-like protein n=1 Tax=Polychytrium aggregatum TaxID=110093 RepID=UPI0022FE9F2B|nr:Metalloenzyme, LuxS/M16 peptidase-like protein [Polychytrium aggregatum]KAI9205080.1 Metalloenzyme, LuxS/M16 peptidase-like protein [Polychytrium aggregatum]
MLPKVVRSAAARSAQSARAYSVLSTQYSATTFVRKGDQVASAPQANKVVSKSKSGITVATYDSKGPASSLAVVIGAGSRHESAPGVAHLLKSSLIRNLPDDTIVRTIRETELRGDSFYASHTRESIVLGSDFLRDNLVDAVPLLLSHVFNKQFHPYEFYRIGPKTAAESSVTLADPVASSFEAVHRVAFRNGLGNSLFASEASVKALNRAKLHEFANNYFTADNITIVGNGVAHQDLVELVDKALESVQVNAKKAETTATKYFGGEHRIEAGPQSTATYVVAFPSVARGSNDYAAALVLSSLLGGSQRIKWGASSALLGEASTANTSSSAFNASYSDAGLLGFVVQGQTADVKSVAQRSIDALKKIANGSVSEADVAAAKKATIIDAEAGVWGSRETSVKEIAAETLTTGSFAAPTDFAQQVQKVTAADLSKIARAALAARPSIVAHGNTVKLPYADELSF